MSTAVVVGISGDIGGALSQKLSDEYEIIGLARRSENSQNIACDLTSLSSIQRAMREIKKRTAQIELLVLAAGVATYKPLRDVTDNDLQQAFMVNTIAPAIIIRELLPLLNHPASLVLSLGSGCGVIPMADRSIYCATKFALRGLSLSLSEEYPNHQPQFCVITLGSTLTAFGPMTLAQKQAAAAQGRAYFPLEWVINKLSDVIHDPQRANEIVLYPSEHGFGTWPK